MQAAKNMFYKNFNPTQPVLGVSCKCPLGCTHTSRIQAEVEWMTLWIPSSDIFSPGAHLLAHSRAPCGRSPWEAAEHGWTPPGLGRSRAALTWITVLVECPRRPCSLPLWRKVRMSILEVCTTCAQPEGTIHSGVSPHFFPRLSKGN